MLNSVSVVKPNGLAKSSTAGKRLLLLSSAISLAILAPAQAGTIVSSDINLTGSYNGHAAGGYTVISGSITANDATFYNFRTVGGNGSGGGAALGGVMFINSGASATLTNVTFLGNTAKGGNAVTGAIAGGTMNNLGFSPSGNGAAGGNGLTPSDNEYMVGDGNGNGLSGGAGLDGANSTTGFGGTGGVGGSGESGWSHNPLLQNGVALATIAETTATFDLAKDFTNQTADGALCGSGNLGGPLTSDPVLCAKEIEDAVVIIKDTANLAAATDALVFAGNQLSSWNDANNRGQVGIGGDGGSGGTGGASAFGLGGGVGGNGGAGGAGGGAAVSGTGGDGGGGGLGGFGAGGGAGGNGGSSTSSALLGAAGAGGIGGFGGGNGSDGTGYKAATQMNGGGGAGLGGSIFVRDGGSLTIAGNAYFDGGNVIGGVAGKNGVAGSADGSDIFMMTGATVVFAGGEGGVQTFDGTINDDSMGSPLSGTYSGTVMYPIGAGAGITIESGHINFNGGNLYSGVTKIQGGVLEAADGGGLPSGSNLDFDGTGNTGGVFMSNGDFVRYLGTDGYLLQWTGSGGFASDGDGGMDVNLNGGQQLTWDADSFVPTGHALLFGDADATDAVYWANDIDLNGDVRTILVASNDDNSDFAEMDGVLSNGGVNIGDADHGGVLIFTADNTYQGTTDVAAGATLVLEGDGSIAQSSVVTIDGTLDISSTDSGGSLVTLAGSGTVDLGTRPLTITDGSTEFDGVIQGAGGLDVAGGTQALGGVNTYTGTTTIEAGAQLVLTGDGSIETSVGLVDNGDFDISGNVNGAKVVTLSGSGTVDLGNQNLTITDGSTTFDGVIEGGGELKITGGSETLTGINTYTGLTVIDAGDPPDLILSGDGSISESAGVVDNSVFDISATNAGATIKTLSGNGSVVLGAQTLTLSAASNTFDGVISGSGGFHVAAGTETLTGTNTHGGKTTIDAGAGLVLTGTGAIAASAEVVDNGLFDISGTSNGASIVTLSGDGDVALGAQRLTITGGSTNFAGVVDGSNGVAVSGGTQTLSGVNTYSGGTIVNTGATLALSDGGSVADSSGVTANGTFDIAATSAGADIKTLDGAGKVVLGGETLTLTAASETFDGVISGTGGFTVAAGTETLTGANSFTGMTGVASGATIKLTGTGSIAASSEVADDGTFDITGTTAGASITTLSGSGDVLLGNQTLTFTAGSTNFAGVASGTGGLTVAGGSQTLSGVNGYTGDTAISNGATLALSGGGGIAVSSGVSDNGTLDISATSSGASIKTLSGTGNVALGGQTLTLTAASGMFSGVIGGSGGFAVTGGTETLTGVNTYAGGTTIDHAMLKVNGNAALGDAAGPVAMNNGTLTATGTLIANRATTLTSTNTFNTNTQLVTWSGVIGGSGSLIADGGGTLTLTGNNTYAGGTSIVNHTTVSVCSDANLGAASGPLTVTDGLLVVTCSFSTSRNITLNGTGKIDSGGNGLDLSGPITLNPGNGPVLLYTGTVHTTGAWSLDPQDGLYVSGTLSGVGTVSQKVTIAGTLSPGNSPGTITFLNSVVMLPASTTALDVDGTGTGTGAGNYDRIVVSGAGHTFAAGGQMVVKLRGITGAANNNFTPVVGQRFNVVHADGGVVASYAGLTEPATGLATGTQFDAVYSDTDIDLVATPVSYANLTPLGVTDTANRMSLGSAINAYRLAPGVRMTGDRNPVLTALYSLPAGSIGASMDQVAGSVQGDVMNAALNLNRLFASATEDHRNGRSLMASAIRGGNSGYLAMNGVAAPHAASGGSADTPFWAVGVGSWTNTATDGNAPGYVGNAGGLILGLDLQKDAASVVGIAAGYARATVDTKNGATADVQTERLIAYGNLTSGDWHFDGELSAAADQFGSKRLIQIGALTRTAQGDTGGWAFAADGGVHYGAGFASPFVEARYDYVSRSGFTETAAGDLSLIVRDESLDTPRVLTGLDVDLNRMVGDSTPLLALNIRLAYAHDFSRIDGQTDAALAGAPLAGFTALSSRIGQDAGIANVSASAHVDDTVSLFGEYHVEGRTRQVSQSVEFGLRADW